MTSWSPLGDETRARSACARRFSRFRPDRELPNDVSVFKRVNDALTEELRVDEEELLAKIDQFSAEASSASASVSPCPSSLLPPLPSRDDEVAMGPNIDQISDVHRPQSEVIDGSDENFAAQIETQKALNASSCRGQKRPHE